MQNNVKIAVTGGIGSGKSTICEFIKNLGYHVISCDEIYKTVLENDGILKKLTAEFGKDIVKDGKLDRAKLSSIVFCDEKKLEKLNGITHPEIMKELFTQAKNYKLCFCEVPLLFEGGFEKDFDGVIVVLRNLNDRISAVANRDKLSEEIIKNRINAQIDYDLCDFEQYYVIRNTNNLENLKLQTAKILQDITESNNL